MRGSAAGAARASLQCVHARDQSGTASPRRILGATRRRDGEATLGQYSRRGVREYWIVDWRLPQVEVYRRENAALSLAETLYAQDVVQSPLLPGFSAIIAQFFEGIPAEIGDGEPA